MKSISYPVWFAILLLAARVSTGAKVPLLTDIAQVRVLSREQAAKNLPVRVHGVVTWGNGTNGWFTIQDDSAGLGIDMSLARSLRIWQGNDVILLKVRVGTEIEIEGVSHAAGFAPLILPKVIHVLGERVLPLARPMLPARFFGGCDACERIEVRGVIQGFQETRLGDWALLVDANPGSFSAEVPRTILSKPQSLVDAEVCLRGVAATEFNSRGEITGTRLLVSQAADLVVEKPAAPSPFDAPKVALNQLLPFSDKPFASHRELVEGTVTYAQSGNHFYIQDGDTAIRVETLSPEALRIGDRVQVAGFVDMQRQVAGLSGAVIRKIGTAVTPPAERIRPDKILAVNTTAALTGQTAQPNDFDGHLITFRAQLIDVQLALNPKQSSRRLTLKAGDTVVEALLQQGNIEVLNALQPGSELQVTGIVQLEYSGRQGENDYHSRPPTGISILLASANDVVVVQAPPWWTPQRLIALMAFGGILLAGVLLWTWQLRRQLDRKTVQLVSEMHARRDAAIEFQATLRERNRLAANLHDTLLQSISGLNYQLEACEVESLPRTERKSNHLETARRMVQRAQEDLRGTVWALRVMPLHDLTFADALRALAEKLAEGREVAITITTEGELPRLSDFVAGNLLLVAQEAINNALKHARPSKIEARVSVSPDGQNATLSVRDDGAGFNTEKQPRPNSGHFGLAGMRERIENLDGELWVESRPGHGACVRAVVSLHSFDKELAGL